ncbi:class II aldolase/adducin family protein, partial [Zavarzinia sp.]|uniref:class II aldolase/adducin family protein n=1 Tax=Zavarzinia sp. TaxID=2027920 RepID=UPI003567CBBD
MEAALRELIEISNRSGADPRLVQGGGGNTSVKSADGKHMFIKASGTALKDMGPSRGWRRMRLEQLRGMLDDRELLELEPAARDRIIVSRLLAACQDDMPAASRPSVEAHLHALLDRVVIHLHPSVVNGFVNSRLGRAEIEKLFADDPPLWVPYVDPGLLLARKMARLVEAHRRRWGKPPSAAFLEKHGLFVSAPDARTAMGLVARTVGRLEKHPAARTGGRKRKTAGFDPVEARRTASAIRAALFRVDGRYRLVRGGTSRLVEDFMAMPGAARLSAAGPMSPDELVYCGGAPLWLENAGAESLARRLEARKKAGLKLPAAFLAPGRGLIIAGDERTLGTLREVAESSLYARACASRLGGFRPLSRREAAFIGAWESESYRMQMAGQRFGGDLPDRIAVVSGAGSGLGRAIAVGLARAGAAVALADIDLEAAAESANLILSELP